MNPPIRMIATDMDGTLLDAYGLIPMDNLRAIRKAQEKGIQVVIASGRFPINAFLKIQESDLKCPIMGSNGAHLTDENLRTLATHAMKKDAAQQVLDIVLRSGADCFIFQENALCTTRLDAVHHSELSHGDKVRALGFTYFHGPEAAKEFVEAPVHKFYICNNVPLEPIRQDLEHVPGILITRSGEYNIEVMPQGVDKGSGIREMAALLGIPMSQVMALGDHDNDIPMLRAAGWGVAMGNACDAAKRAAKAVTADHRACGFARAVEKYALAD